MRARRALIRAETIIDRPFLVPEVSMHLITDACPLWKATDADLERLGLPAPYWAFAWSGGQALARHILDHPEEVSSRTVLSFGAGGGVEALAAARAGARRVIASDIDPFAIEALHLNAALNDVDIEATIDDLIGHIDPAWDIVLAADVTYETELTARVIDWLAELQARGVEVRIADPGRGFLNPARLEMLAEYDAPSDIDIDGSDLRVTPVYRLHDE
ncbi:MAG: 50S ribosomal protein L11 methyltransferase [Myxococcota bacterium]